MTASTKKFFVDKRFYLHIKGRGNAKKAAETILVFGGSIDQFLEKTISYVLTDVPKSDWPPNGNDDELITARKFGVKLMSYQDLVDWCSKYISSQSSSDEDDDIKTSIKELHEPYLKFEDNECRFQPVVRQLSKWPEINFNVPNNASIFTEPSLVQTQIEKNAQQLVAPQTTPTPGTAARTGVRRKSPIYCDLCGHKLTESLEEHEESDHHKSNLKRFDWSDVESVIKSLPSFSSLNMRRIQKLPGDYGNHQEFLCLHKVESVSQIQDRNTSWLLG